MTVKTSKVQSALIVKFKTGVDSKGNDVVNNQRFSKVKVSAADEDVLIVGQAISSLLAYPLVEVTRDDQSLIINE